jgi:hypothetical protein
MSYPGSSEKYYNTKKIAVCSIDYEAHIHIQKTPLKK